MQIKPAVGAEFWERQGQAYPHDPEMLLQPEHNIEVGCWYLERFSVYVPSSSRPHAVRPGALQCRDIPVSRGGSAPPPPTRKAISWNVDFPRTREYILRVIDRANRRSQNYLW